PHIGPTHLVHKLFRTYNWLHIINNSCNWSNLVCVQNAETQWFGWCKVILHCDGKANCELGGTEFMPIPFRLFDDYHDEDFYGLPRKYSIVAREEVKSPIEPRFRDRQHFVLSDINGAKIEAITYMYETVKHFDNLLHEKHVYKMHNVKFSLHPDIMAIVVHLDTMHRTMWGPFRKIVIMDARGYLHIIKVWGDLLNKNALRWALAKEDYGIIIGTMFRRFRRQECLESLDHTAIHFNPFHHNTHHFGYNANSLQEKIPVVDELTPPIPRRSCKKSLGVVVEATVEAGAPSELKSSKSAKGAEVGFATPFGSLRLLGVTVGAILSAEIVACVPWWLLKASRVESNFICQGFFMENGEPTEIDQMEHNDGHTPLTNIANTITIGKADENGLKSLGPNVDVKERKRQRERERYAVMTVEQKTRKVESVVNGDVHLGSVSIWDGCSTIDFTNFATQVPNNNTSPTDNFIERERQRHRERHAKMSVDQRNELNKKRREARQQNKGQHMMSTVSGDGDEKVNVNQDDDSDWLHRNETFKADDVFTTRDLLTLGGVHETVGNTPNHNLERVAYFRERYKNLTPAEREFRCERLRLYNNTPKRKGSKIEYIRKRRALLADTLSQESIAMECPTYAPEVVHPTTDAVEPDGSAVTPYDWVIPEIASNPFLPASTQIEDADSLHMSTGPLRLDDDNGVEFEDGADENEGYLFAGQYEDTDDDIEIHGSQDESTTTDVPDPYDKVYINIPEETHMFKTVPNCSYCTAKKFEYETPEANLDDMQISQRLEYPWMKWMHTVRHIGQVMQMMKMQMCPGVFNPTLHGKRLFQQFAIDTYIKIESSRLDYIRRNQDRLRADLYQGLVDSMLDGDRAEKVGKRTMLSTSFIGGPRDMRRRYMDAMALVRKFGKPDIFLTMTCNPNWDEIRRELLPGQTPQDRPDLVVRVFHAKLQELKHRLTKQDILGKDSYPIYRRRDDDRKEKVRGCELGNRWVVPYNPYLLRLFNCHINVEACGSIKAVKYLFKYIYKGHDRASVVMRDASKTYDDVDEIKQYRDARWVTPPEALWRIYNFEISQISPPVMQLQLHLPNMHMVAFHEWQMVERVINRPGVDRSMLTTYFEANMLHEEARGILYRDFPEWYTWQSGKGKIWQRRKLDTGGQVGRIVSAHPAEGERYYLRVLLNHVTGAASYVYLRTVDGVTLPTFREAVERRELLESDNTLDECLTERALFQMPSALRRHFATILVYCEPSDVAVLWQKHKDSMSEDYQHGSQNKTHVEQMVLIDIRNMLQSMGKDIKTFPLPPIIDAYDDAIGTSREGGLFFVDGPGGTGKTYLYRVLLVTLRNQGKIAVATATSGVAASIMPGGRTAHSRFKIPHTIDDAAVCIFTKQSGTTELLQKASLIIWDEASMTKRQAVEALDNSMRDIMGRPALPFGGKTIVFGGDFRQVLPVVCKGSRAQVVVSSLRMSYLWESMSHLKLVINMRAKNDPWFAEFLLCVGGGTEETNSDGDIRLSDDVCVPYSGSDNDLDNLIDFAFPNLNENMSDSTYITSRAILSTQNDWVDMINVKMIDRFQGEHMVYHSFDSAMDDPHNYYPPEFLNTLTPNGLPPHVLKLKIGCPVILLRNIDPVNGLCNGTRLVVCGFQRNSIDAKIVLGQQVGKRIFLPRIPLCPSDEEMFPFQLKRKQFPVWLSFAMTVNKAHGQTIPNVGVYLLEPVFSHGQLYVVLSRATTRSNIKILVIPVVDGRKKSRKGVKKNPTVDCGTYTKNIVYKEILEYSLDMVRKLSAAAKEDEMKKNHDKLLSELSTNSEVNGDGINSFVIAVIKGLRFILEEIKELKAEVSKARIQMMQQIIKESAGVGYLQKAFADRYGPPESAPASLPLTLQWILTSKNIAEEEWSEHSDCLSIMPATGQAPALVPVLRSGHGAPVGQPSPSTGDTSGQPEWKKPIPTGDRDRHKLLLDYICMQGDLALIDFIKEIPYEPRVEVVLIDDAFVERKWMECLFQPNAYLGDEVIDCYINLIKAQKHLKCRSGGRVNIENAFQFNFLKRDGDVEIKTEELYPIKDMTQICSAERRVFLYLDHDMVFIPINIREMHWYLAVIHARNMEIQVLDSLGTSQDRKDLTDSVRLQRQIDMISQRKELKDHRWPDLQVASWPLREIDMGYAKQTNSSSCDLFLLNYIKYWTGDELSDSFTQDDMSHFRKKMAAILLSSDLNKRRGCLLYKNEKEVDSGSPSDVEILENPIDSNKRKLLHMLDDSEVVYEDEEGPITQADLQRRTWVQSFNPFKIEISVKDLQNILTINQDMILRCFDIAVRLFANKESRRPKEEIINNRKHYMDMRFWRMVGFGKLPKYHQDPTTEELAKTLDCWPSMNSYIMGCRYVLMPWKFNGCHALFVIDHVKKHVTFIDFTPTQNWCKHMPYKRFNTNYLVLQAMAMWGNDRRLKFVG
ncbi:hypothetical protein ACJX0J_041928, partial [Zea mays]